jgi:hypothetical protein
MPATMPGHSVTAVTAGIFPLPRYILAGLALNQAIVFVATGISASAISAQLIVVRWCLC